MANTIDFTNKHFHVNIEILNEEKIVQDINLYQLLKFYAKNWIWIVSITLTSLVLGIIFCNFIQTPMYKSEATLLLVRSNSLASGTSQDTVLINNYIELFKSRRVLDPVIEKQKLNIAYDEMAGLVEASNSKSTEVIKVAVSTTDAEKSKSFLEEAVISFKAQVKQLYKLDNVKVVDSASLASKSYNINKGLTILLSTVAGFLFIIIILFFVYDFRISTKSKKTSDEPTDDGELVVENVDVLIQPDDVLRIPEIKNDTPNNAAVVEPKANPSTYTNTLRARDRLFQASYPRERNIRR
ncbi:hypothetical protein CVV43_01640 [Candidatus Saccharibacteria bacterium HGW-Saccharibacteria-1]|nr:MAG: hypothetical protein CVV43_01640 [Candidatus Saccharibacteria bacterium HGW-Saccharibacteria-1]